jgi:hypothetical protein
VYVATSEREKNGALSMSSMEFVAFVDGLNEKADDEELDNVETIKRWLINITDLFDDLSGYLQDHVKAGKISISSSFVSINEEFLGVYEAPKLTIKIGNSEAELVPIGRMIFGAQGRIDLRGPVDVKKFVLVPEDLTKATIRIMSQQEAKKEANENKGPSKLAWKISSGPRHDYTDLNAETFANSLMSVIR